MHCNMEVTKLSEAMMKDRTLSQVLHQIIKGDKYKADHRLCDSQRPAWLSVKILINEAWPPRDELPQPQQLIFFPSPALNQ